MVITGANAGLGLATAIEMGSRGATVVFGCRNMKQGQIAVDRFKRVTGSERAVRKMHVTPPSTNIM